MLSASILKQDPNPQTVKMNVNLNRENTKHGHIFWVKDTSSKEQTYRK